MTTHNEIKLPNREIDEAMAPGFEETKVIPLAREMSPKAVTTAKEWEQQYLDVRFKLWDATLYAAADAVNTLRVRNALQELLDAATVELRERIQQFSLVDRRAHIVMGDMELEGLGVDKEYLDAIEKSARALVERDRHCVEREIPEFFNARRGKPWIKCNWTSSQGLAHILFDARAGARDNFDPRIHGWGIEPVLPGKGQYDEQERRYVRQVNHSTNSTHLILIRKYRARPNSRLSRFIDAILKYRKIQKLHSTYMAAIPKFLALDARDRNCRRIYPMYNATATKSGRSSSAFPNLHNIPRLTDEWDIRRMFLPRPGNAFIAADWSNMEMRIAAGLSGDQALKNVFLNDICMHKQTAAAIFQINYDDVTKEQRAVAKPVNYGSLYGISAPKLAIQIEIQTGNKISEHEAQQYIDAFWRNYSRLHDWVQEQQQCLMTTRVVHTYYGRPRHAPKNPTASDIRSAINSIIQGSGSDFLKEALWNLSECYRNDPEVIIPCQIHDEIICEAPYHRTLEVRDNLVNIMYRRVNDVPIPVDGEIKLTLSKNARNLSETDLTILQNGGEAHDFQTMAA